MQLYSGILSPSFGVPEDGTALKKTEENSDVMIMDKKTYSTMTGQQKNGNRKWVSGHIT